MSNERELRHADLDTLAFDHLIPTEVVIDMLFDFLGEIRSKDFNA